MVVVQMLALAACGAQPTAKLGPPSPVAYDSPQAFIAGLLQAGAEVEVGETLAPLPGTESGRALFLEQERVEVYPFEAGSVTQAGLQAAGPRSWLQPGMLVVYAGDDGGTILLLSGLLGDPQAAEAPAQDEPYPPAVAVAILQAAARAGAAPSEVMVLSFDEQRWPDDCLGLPPAAAACGGEPVDGWRIELQVGRDRLTVHTDLVGGRIRFADGLAPTTPEAGAAGWPSQAGWLARGCFA